MYSVYHHQAQENHERTLIDDSKECYRRHLRLFTPPTQTSQDSFVLSTSAVCEEA